MKTGCAGGGTAGLHCALLMKQPDARHDLTAGAISEVDPVKSLIAVGRPYAGKSPPTFSKPA